MSSPSKPNFDAPPSFQADKYLTGTQESLYGTGQALTQGKFLDPNDPTVGFLNQLVTLNPEASQKSFDLATRDVERLRQAAYQQTINDLEANNQLTSSVTGNKLSDLNQKFSEDISDIASEIYIADVNRSMSNIGSLFDVGLDTLNNVGNRGLQNQQQVNSFNQWQWGANTALENERFQRQLENEKAQAEMWGTWGGPVVGSVAGLSNGGASAGMAGFNSGFTLPSMVLSAMSGNPAAMSSSMPQNTTTTTDSNLNRRLLEQSRGRSGMGTPSSGGLV